MSYFVSWLFYLLRFPQSSLSVSHVDIIGTCSVFTDAQTLHVDSEDNLHGHQIDFSNAHRRASSVNKERMPILIFTVMRGKKEVEVG